MIMTSEHSTIETVMLDTEQLNGMSGMDISNIIMTYPQLTCKKCNNFLHPPIKMTSSNGNVCGFCNSLPDAESSITIGAHNLPLEGILQHLMVPCHYANRGCRNILDYFDILEHHLNCKYRKYSCPLKVFGNCNWEDNLGDLIHHFINFHPDCGVRGISNSFSINVDTSSIKDTIKLLYTGMDTFILLVKCGPINISFTLYYIGPKQNLSALAYSIERKDLLVINNSGCGTAVLHESQFKADLIEEHSLMITIEDAEKSATDAVLNITLKVHKMNKHTQDLYKRILPHFECPVCGDYMKPPIFVCLVGHSICHECKPRLQQCPTCRGPLSNTRNHLFEAVSNDMQFPCSEHEGSLQYTVNSKIQQLAQPYQCPFRECDWKGSYSAIVRHLKDNHKDRVTYSNFTMNRTKFDINHQYCLIAHGQIFLISNQYDVTSHCINWSGQLIGPKGNAGKYIFEVNLYKCTNINKRFSQSNICQNLSNDNVCSSSGVVVPFNTAMQFLEDGAVSYCCRIIKIV